MGKVILPKTFIPESEIDRPLLFLAWPIRGAAKRQNEAIDILLAEEPDIMIASPRRKDEITDFVRDNLVEWDESYFPRQRKRENYYLDIASRIWAILFWLPGEEIHKCEKSFGAMTRMELGQWMVHYHYNPDVRFCVGSDWNFSEMSTIQVDLDRYAPDKITTTTLQETCAEALRLAFGDSRK